MAGTSAGISVVMGASVAELDANADGLVTLEEVQVVYPDTTAENFTAMDTNADGSLSDEELSAVPE